MHLTTPEVSPAYIGVGYIIGPELAALNFSGGVLAWGLMVPLLIYLLGPELIAMLPPDPAGGDPVFAGRAVSTADPSLPLRCNLAVTGRVSYAPP